MNAIDDPAIPGDLADVLRTASVRLDVSPAPLRSVQQRARRRRHRRHGLVAGGAAAALLLTALTIAQATAGGGGSERVVTATAPDVAGRSVPQPLLVPAVRTIDEDAPDTDPDAAGGILDEVTASGASAWWTTDGNWVPTSAVVLADGRRFGVAATNPLDQSTPVEARLDEIGPDGRTVSSQPLALESPEGSPATIRLVGAVGTEIIIVRSTETIPERPPGSTQIITIDETSAIAAHDVDSGAERTLLEDDARGVASAAGAVLARSTGTDCTLSVQPTDGTGAPRELHGRCPSGVKNLEGMALRVAVSPDGADVAVVWTMIRPAGLPQTKLTVLDVATGAMAYEADGPSEWSAIELAWTGDHTLRAAIRPGAPALPVVAGPISVETVTSDEVGGG